MHAALLYKRNSGNPGHARKHTWDDKSSMPEAATIVQGKRNRNQSSFFCSPGRDRKLDRDPSGSSATRHLGTHCKPRPWRNRAPRPYGSQALLWRPVVRPAIAAIASEVNRRNDCSDICLSIAPLVITRAYTFHCNTLLAAAGIDAYDKSD